jgi:hypothetical protein
VWSMQLRLSADAPRVLARRDMAMHAGVRCVSIKRCSDASAVTEHCDASYDDTPLATILFVAFVATLVNFVACRYEAAGGWLDDRFFRLDARKSLDTASHTLSPHFVPLGSQVAARRARSHGGRRRTRHAAA